MFTLSRRCLVSLVAAFVRDERGDDMIEYALLAALIGIVGVVAFNTMSTQMGTAYSNWNSTQHSNWEPNAPLVVTSP
jgi:pilus assembly protein Flp/PilA